VRPLRRLSRSSVLLALVAATLVELTVASAVVVRREERPAPARAGNAATTRPIAPPPGVVVNSRTIAAGLPDDAGTQAAIGRYLTRRETAARALLARRAHALNTHNKAEFLATVDGSVDHGAVRAAQAKLFDAIVAAPVGGWTFTIYRGVEISGINRSLLARFGSDAWVPEVHERYRYLGFDARPTERLRGLTLANRKGRWLIVSDHGTSIAEDLRVDLWDFGAVTVRPAGRSIVVGHVGDPVMDRVVPAVEDGVRRVTAVFGNGWDQRAVILVPGSQTEFGRLIGRSQHLSEIGAVAVRQVNGNGEYTGQRVIVNPKEFRDLGAAIRGVILTHELAHVATRDLSDGEMPLFMIEGFADYVGFRDSGYHRGFSPALTAKIRAGKVPALPEDEVFQDGSPKAVADAYHVGVLLCGYVADRLGEKALVSMYRALADTHGGTGASRFYRVLERRFALSRSDFERGWLDYLRAELDR
jgi:hypothetical protein